MIPTMQVESQPLRSNGRRIAVIGAGPIGLECALYGARLGHAVDLYESGEVAEHVGLWGHARMFSPWEMNVSALGLRALESCRPATRAGFFARGVCPTGAEYRERYLLRLSESPALAGRVHLRTRVLAVGRCGVLKSEMPGSTERSRHPFRLLLSADGRERFAEADAVVDCSGVFSSHRWMGNGGIPAAGERELEASLDYGLPDAGGTEAERFAGRRTLVVGSGHSAATVVESLAALAARAPGTSVLWLLRGAGRDPYAPIAGDPLPERAALASRAAALAGGSSPAVEPVRGWAVEAVHRQGGDGFEVTLSRGGEERTERVERIVACVGGRPESSLYRELQVHECYASEGPMNLAAALLGAGSADCLAQKSHGAETLRNPEPDFFILGAKSYGRNPHFLVRLGLDQVRELYQALEADTRLDLYAAEAA
jgi:hypothetical protein